MFFQDVPPVIYILENDSELIDQHIDRIKSYLPSERIARSEKYKRKKDRDACLISFFLLIYGLKKLGIDKIPKIQIGEYEKPFFTDCNLNFNISHCDKAVCCGISENDIGVDIQEKVSYFKELIECSMTEKESDLILSSQDGSTAFIRNWCLKEAYLKFKGIGLNHPLKEIEFLDTNDVFFQYNCLFTIKEINEYLVCACTLDKAPVFIKKNINEYLDDIK